SKYPNSKYVNQAKDKIKELEELQAWNKVRGTNTIYAFENFIQAYPNSKYVLEAKNSITKIKEQRDWDEANRIGTVESYKKYLDNYPYGDHYSIATDKLKELEIIGPEWQKTLKTNTLDSYRLFVSKYPQSSFARLAYQKIEEIEIKEWDNAIKKNTIKSFQDYLTKFPSSEHREEAEKKIIDLEVDAIFSGSYGKLPPMSRSNSNTQYTTTNTIEIHNKTKFNLTIRYSGIESKKIILRADQKRTITLTNGTYRVAASVAASNVQNYAGKESLLGGQYFSEYWIETRRY